LALLLVKSLEDFTLGTDTLSLAKSLADFRQSQAKTKVACSQHSKETIAGPIPFYHMGPMSVVTML
jgi:hypothetical protein